MKQLFENETRLVAGGDVGRWVDTDGDGIPDTVVGCTEDPLGDPGQDSDFSRIP